MQFLNADKNNLPRIILVTGHRRENFGHGFDEICQALKDIALENSDVQIVYPVHLNPNVREPVNRILSGINNIHLIEPMEYISFIKLMDLSYLVLTDSGGIQEEAPTFGVPVLLLREETERPEGLDIGIVRLVGTNEEAIVTEGSRVLEEGRTREHTTVNPFGDGRAGERISDIIVAHLTNSSRSTTDWPGP